MLLVIPTHVEDNSRPLDPPTANAVIIACNVILYFLGFYAPVGPDTGPFSILGYSFSHAGVAHLVVNMWALVIFGNVVNRRLGNAYYLACYLGTAAMLGLSARFLAGSYLVGSSGAVFAVVAVFAMLMPAARTHVGYVAVLPVTLLFGLFARPTHWLHWLIRWDAISIRAWWCLLLIPLTQLIGLVWWRPNWTNFGHLVGFFCGVAFVLLLPNRLAMPRRARFEY